MAESLQGKAEFLQEQVSWADFSTDNVCLLQSKVSGRWARCKLQSAPRLTTDSTMARAGLNWSRLRKSQPRPADRAMSVSETAPAHSPVVLCALLVDSL